ncbi:MAG: 4Fe-4S dicluster domain-containing protein [Dissulfurimicrobium sp.]|uniref:4Fe-4S dicluster domain-containing protein n=1 Tax=Dissulfurimicrobium TaxID=1769732 RepID=UPI001EDC64D7|nr:4Fe-4S dicluster domain-containing protein [Dissulfurimicrobium hydrothermale]UKL13566.1 4Fe-4S dicluster domain-containing protein [Dissulfurimicrobium hydrothermale]
MSHTNAEITEGIRAKAAELLSSGEVAVFLGFIEGSIPMTLRPFVARRPEDAERFVWNSFCVMNLANYLPSLLKSLEPPRGLRDPVPAGPLPKVGVVATGCWSRNIVVQMQERQVDRKRLVILGVSSRGMVDRKKVMAMTGGREIFKVEEGEHTLKISGSDYGLEIDRWSVVRDNCKSCVHPDPVIFDYKIGPDSNRKADDRFAQIEVIEAMTVDERWAWFKNEIASCIRCYACRNACPLCYCPTCFVDDSRPQWVGKSIDPTDTALFHILRAFHCAGRCTDCGACESACPMGIKMRLFTKKLEKDVFELFGVEAGLDPLIQPPLVTYRPDDPQGFVIIKEKNKA